MKSRNDYKQLTRQLQTELHEMSHQLSAISSQTQSCKDVNIG